MAMELSNFPYKNLELAARMIRSKEPEQFCRQKMKAKWFDETETLIFVKSIIERYRVIYI